MYISIYRYTNFLIYHMGTHFAPYCPTWLKMTRHDTKGPIMPIWPHVAPCGPMWLLIHTFLPIYIYISIYLSIYVLYA